MRGAANMLPEAAICPCFATAASETTWLIHAV
jgi:hypothetical protein